MKRRDAEFAAFAAKDQNWTHERANEELSTMSYQVLVRVRMKQLGCRRGIEFNAKRSNG